MDSSRYFGWEVTFQAEQDILKSCPTVPITRLYSKYEDLSN